MQHRTQYFGFLFQILSQVSTLNILSFKHMCSTKLSNPMELAENLKVIASSSLSLCDHQYISSIKFLAKLCVAVSSVSKCQPLMYCQFFLFLLKAFTFRAKKPSLGKDMSVYEHTWKVNFFHMKEPIFYVHCREQNRTLWSYALDLEGRNQQWQVLGWVIWKKDFMYTLHVYQITRFAK